MRESMRARHYRSRTEETCCQWVRRYILFHQKRHPADMGEPEINAFLTHLAVKDKVSASTQNIIGRDVGEVIRARKPKRLPVVMTIQSELFRSY